VLLNNVMKDMCKTEPESGCASFSFHSDKHVITSLLCLHALLRPAGQNESLTSSPFFILDFMFHGSPLLLPLKSMFKLSLSLMRAGLVYLP